jgi:hypothetical protein
VLWDCLLGEVTHIINGEKTNTEKKFHDGNVFQTSFAVHKEDDRIHVSMGSFGYEITYSWKIHIEGNGRHSLIDFRMEKSTFTPKEEINHA